MPEIAAILRHATAIDSDEEEQMGAFGRLSVPNSTERPHKRSIVVRPSAGRMIAAPLGRMS